MFNIVFVSLFSILLTFAVSWAYDKSWTPVCGSHEKTPADPEECMFSPGIINRWGYPALTYKVTTSDGYILTMFRIPFGKKGPDDLIKPVALLQHGLLGASDTFLTNLPNEGLPCKFCIKFVKQDAYPCLAYILADAGYDVWLGNVRGNRYSRAHKTLDPNKNKTFWEFCWDDMAAKDLPAMINKVLETTGQAQLDYIAHSQGTLIGFAKFSEDETFSKKIRTFYALAPVSSLKHITSNIKDFAEPWLMDSLENIAAKKMQKFDYGKEGNMKHYGQETPPLYHVENMKVPTVFFSGGADGFADPKDVAILAKKIQAVLRHQFFYKDFMHLDFTYGLGAYKQVYPPLIEMMKNNSA